MTTRLICVRHAKPEDPDPDKYPDDRLRPLSQKGREVQQAEAHRLSQPIDVAYASEFLRAQQTAEILAAKSGCATSIAEALGAEFDAKTLLTYIHPDKTTLFVGHDPTLAAFVNELLAEPFLLSGMVKSGAVILEFPEGIAFGKGRLIDYLRPE